MQFCKPRVSETLNATDSRLQVAETNAIIISETRVSSDAVGQPLRQLQPTYQLLLEVLQDSTHHGTY